MFKNILKSILSQKFINNFYHLPMAVLASALYGFPAKKLTVIGVTGTDGKTTTINMIYQILKAVGKKVSMISTINAVIGEKSYETGFHVTSPDPFMVQKFAKQAVDCGDKYLVLEVTSHGLDQHRFWGIKFDVGVITNITHEHLDYHKTHENYKKTKLKLLQNTEYAVVNENIIVGDDKAVTFGLNKGDFNQKDLKLNLKILGNYNIENALAALAVADILGIDKSSARKSLENFENLTGRMEFVENKEGIKIVIDFAHTPNGLKQALLTLRTYSSPGRLIAVFGAEGFRDAGKRAMMGEIAQKIADAVVITAVDPRGQLKIINQQISQGAKKAGGKEGSNFFIIDDRQEALDFAINNLAKTGDCVGIFGKGHERSMNLDGREEIPWSDRKAVKKVLSLS